MNSPGPRAQPQDDDIIEDEDPLPITASITPKLGTPRVWPPQTDDDDTITEYNAPKRLHDGFGVKLSRRSRRLKLPEQRYRLARALMVTVAILAIGILLAVMFTGESRLENLKSTAAIIFGPLVTLLGTSFAWYFAKSS